MTPPSAKQCRYWALEAGLGGYDGSDENDSIKYFAALAHAAGYAAGLEAAATICEETKRQYGHRLANAIRGAKAAP